MTQFPANPVSSPAWGAVHQSPPPVVMWFKLYCAGMTLMYALVAAASLLFFFVDAFRADMGESGAIFMGVMFLGMGGFFLAMYIAGILLPPRPWVWIYDLVLIAIGLTSCLTMAASIPLLIFWLKPETRMHFGRT